MLYIDAHVLGELSMNAVTRFSAEKFAQIHKTIDVLNEHFPKAFPKKGGHPVQPLKLHIHKDILQKSKELNLGITWSQVRAALSFWCSRAYYLTAFKNAAHRIDLNGEVVYTLSSDHRAFAKARKNKKWKKEIPATLAEVNEAVDEAPTAVAEPA
jgi:ProP effector